MNKVETELYGGFPWELDHWRWEIEAHRAAFGAMGKAFQAMTGNAGAVILDGIKLVATYPVSLVVTPGAVVIGSELFLFGGGVANIANTPETLWLDVVQETSPTGTKVFEDGTTQETHLIRRVQLRVGNSPPAPGVVGVRLADVPRIEDAEADPGPWVPMPSTSFTNDFVPYGGDVSLRLDRGVVRFRGDIQYVGVTGTPVNQRAAFRIPEPYRSLETAQWPVCRREDAFQGGIALPFIAHTSPFGYLTFMEPDASFINGMILNLTPISYVI